MGLVMEQLLAFDDVLLVPQYSKVLSRDDISLTTRIGITEYKLPIMSSPMDTVTEHRMASAIHQAGGLGVIHRYNTIEEQIVLFQASGGTAACAIGATGDYEERAAALIEAGCNTLCIDVAHGHHVLVELACEYLRKEFPDIILIAGNVATSSGYLHLASCGVDAVRVGLGCGAACKTRAVSGHGVPQLSAIMEIHKTRIAASARLGMNPNYLPVVIADGGIRSSADAVKAFAAGADWIMLGSMLAGTEESPGEALTVYDKKCKPYRGMASPEAQMGWQGKVRSIEGIATYVPYKGDVKDTLDSLAFQIKGGLSYSGCLNLEEFRTRAQFIRITQAGYTEGTPHILDDAY